MPELPEVETMRIQLEKFLVGHVIDKIEIRDKRYEIRDKEKLVGTKIDGVRRFAKVTSIDLSNGYSILTHVKLTGQYIYRGPNLPHVAEGSAGLSKKVVGGVPGPHTLIIFNLDRDGKLYYNDIRRFGWIKIVKTSEVENEPFVKKLGPEPFKGLALKVFQEILSKNLKGN